MNIKHFCLFCSLLVSYFAFSQKSIFDVARSGTLEELKTLMSINSDTINAVDENGFVPLAIACYRGSEDVALYMASNVENIDGKSEYGTPLMAAVYKSRTNIVERLLELKANANAADANGTTPLHYAIIFRNEPIIKLLMDAGADVNFKDNRGNTAKDYASMTKNESIMKLINN